MKKKLRDHLLDTFSEDDLKSWYDPLRLEFSKDERMVRITFPHGFFAQWFADHVQDKFEERLGLFLGQGFRVRYENCATPAPAGAEARKEPVKYIDFPYGHHFTFDNFLCNRKNYFPLASAREVAKQKDIVYNPFIICGENGSGKTHLLKSIANEISRRFGPRKLYLGTIEDVQSVYASRGKDDVFAGREFLQSHDYLLVDDFQLIRSHQELQQELISLFNHFHDNKKQMIFSMSDKLSSYDFLEPKLKSRLEWGLIVNLKRPDLDVRVEYIQVQCRQRKLELTREQILTLANRYEDFRSLQGIILKLFAFRELVQKDMSESDFEHVLSHTEDRPSETLKPDYILQVVSEYFSVAVKDIQGGKRHHQIVLARQSAMYLCRHLLGISYPALGRIFGGKDHSTVLYSVRKIEESLRDNHDLKNVLTTLKKRCQSFVGKQPLP